VPRPAPKNWLPAAVSGSNPRPFACCKTPEQILERLSGYGIVEEGRDLEGAFVPGLGSRARKPL
jgi:hypothetical protein